MAKFERIFAHELAKVGDGWLATARTWLQSNVKFGDRVIWGSDEMLQMTSRQFEDAAAFIAAAAVNDERESQARTSLWRPIASAPKDGRWVLVWLRGNRLEHDNERPIVGRWHGGDAAWAGWGYPGFGGFRASHWMPFDLREGPAP